MSHRRRHEKGLDHAPNPIRVANGSSTLGACGFGKTKERAAAADTATLRGSDFRFSQVDTICVAPAIDLRSDTAQPITLEPSRPQHFVSGDVAVSADTALPNLFKHIGYKTVTCNSVSATVNELKAPSDAWLRKLDFGESRWLFIFAVEYVNARIHKYLGSSPGGLSHAVVSGYLFQKQADGPRLVWRDTVVGGDGDHNLGAMWIGKKEKTQFYESQQSIEDGAEHLLSKFESRNKSFGFENKTHTEIIDVTCNKLWAALIDVLKKPGQYNILQIDNSVMMAIFFTEDSESQRTAYGNLRPKDNSCSMQITLAPGNALDLKSFSQRVHAALSN